MGSDWSVDLWADPIRDVAAAAPRSGPQLRIAETVAAELRERILAGDRARRSTAARPRTSSSRSSA